MSPVKEQKSSSTCEVITSIPKRLELGSIITNTLSLDLSERAESVSYFDLSEMAE